MTGFFVKKNKKNMKKNKKIENFDFSKNHVRMVPGDFGDVSGPPKLIF